MEGWRHPCHLLCCWTKHLIVQLVRTRKGGQCYQSWGTHGNMHPPFSSGPLIFSNSHFKGHGWIGIDLTWLLFGEGVQPPTMQFMYHRKRSDPHAARYGDGAANIHILHVITCFCTCSRLNVMAVTYPYHNLILGSNALPPGCSCILFYYVLCLFLWFYCLIGWGQIAWI